MRETAQIEAPSPKAERSGTGSTANAWLRALELTAPISRNPTRTLPSAIAELAAQAPDQSALLSDRECLTYGSLAARTNQYARWSLAQGIRKGDVVCLLMANRPEYFAFWLGVTSIGGVVALLNTNLRGPSLAHCVNVVAPKHVVAGVEFIDRLTEIIPQLTGSPTIWSHGAEHTSFSRMDLEVLQQSNEELLPDEKRQLTIEDRALYIFTSGTTGLPKAANISHARVMQWTHWFAGMMDARPEDRMYSCLPMYHSIGGVLVPGATLVGGGTLVIREKFSASQFWNDVIRWDCTMFQYIGEFCRYLLHTPPSSNDLSHRVRLACGNGMSADVWDDFQKRFRVPQVLEFYASTEGGVSLFNVEGKHGAIGRVPGYLTHRFSPALIRLDVENGEPVRNEDGFCIRCAPHEAGEAIGKLSDSPSDVGSRFEGYTDKRASERKILRNVFRPDDAWVRTGDLMRKDDQGFFFFVDRIGDTFRWKGENVSTNEVSEAICSFPGVRHANVYGVKVASNEGRIGMAALVVDETMDLAALREHLMNLLPPYARPAFLRIQNDIDVTGTFKYSKTDLVRQGYDPTITTDPIYFDSPESQAFHRVDKNLYDRIQAGQVRL